MDYRSRKKIKQFAKTQIIEAIKFISYYLNTMYSSFHFHSNEFNQNYNERLFKCIWARFEDHWYLLLRECAKSREKVTQVHQ